MITDADIRKMKKVFVTKDDLKSLEGRQNNRFATKADLKDMRDQIVDNIDGKLVKQKEEIMEEMDGKFAKQKEEIVEGVGEYIADTIVPMFDKRDKQIVRIEKKIGLTPN